MKHSKQSNTRPRLKNRSWREQRGFSLVEILLAAGLSTLLVLMATELLRINRSTSIKSNFRFALEDTARTALELIREKVVLAGHTFCSEIESYEGIFGYFTVNGTQYASGQNWLYYTTNTTNGNFSPLHAYPTGGNPITAALAWFPRLPNNITQNQVNQLRMNTNFDALVVKGLSKHIFQVNPALTPGATAGTANAAGGMNCQGTSPKCVFNLFVGNPLISPSLVFNTAPAFFDATHNVGFTATQKFPIALTDCSNTHQIDLLPYPVDSALFNNPLSSGINSLDDFELPTQFFNFAPNDQNPRVFLQAANFDVIYVDTDGILTYTRPGVVNGLAGGGAGLAPTSTAGSPNGRRGEVAVTGLRFAFGTVDANGLPIGFFRPAMVNAWGAVRVVNMAIAFEVRDYFNTAVSRPQAFLLDQSLAADSSRHLRRIYQQTIFIEN